MKNFMRKLRRIRPKNFKRKLRKLKITITEKKCFYGKAKKIKLKKFHCQLLQVITFLLDNLPVTISSKNKL